MTISESAALPSQEPEDRWRSVIPTSQAELSQVGEFMRSLPKRINARTKQAFCQAIYWSRENAPTEQLAGVIYWARGAMPRRERDQWLGWSSKIRSMRISQVVHLRQFVANHPYFLKRKRQILDSALGSLPKCWEDRFSVLPLLAECYSGEALLQDVDFEEMAWSHASPTDVGQKLWVFPLSDAAVQTLKGEPKELDGGSSHQSAFRFSPDFTEKEIGALVQLMSAIRDMRRKHPDKIPLKSILAVLALSRLSGNRLANQHSEWFRGLPTRYKIAVGIRYLRENSTSVLLSHETITRAYAYLAGRPEDLAQAESILNTWLGALGRERLDGQLFDLPAKRQTRRMSGR